MPALAPRFRVVVPDLPGCHGVPPLAGRHDAASYARWSLELLDRLGIAEVRVAGLCSGTAIALALADAAPDRVRALLLHTPFLRPDVIRPAIRAQLALLSSPLGLLWAPLRKSTFLATLHRRVFANAAEVTAEQLALDQADLVGADARAGRELATDLLTRDRVDTIRRFRGPVGVLLAGSDAFVDAARVTALVRDVAPASTIETIPGGHGWTPAYVAAQEAALTRLAPRIAAGG